MGQDKAETYDDDNYYDMEEELERGKWPESAVKALWNLADIYISKDQVAAKGKLLGCYRSRGFQKVYIEMYEQALMGRAEIRSKEIVDISFGYVRLKEAVVEKGSLYLLMNDETVYRLRHIKMAEEAAYRINEQKRKAEEQKN